jgi:hypothetical protein
MAGLDCDSINRYIPGTRIIGEQREHDIVSPSTAKKRIYNPVTHKYYEIRQNSSKYGEPGQVKGLWSSKKKKSP